MGTRRLGRELSLKVLYAYELTQNDLGDLLEDPLFTPDGESVQFARELVWKTVEHQSDIDREIRVKAQKWRLERIALIDRLILRMAISELWYFDDIPPKVTINEAIEIAKKYSTEKSGQFVNGILDAVYGDMKAGETENNPECSG